MLSISRFQKTRESIIYHLSKIVFNRFLYCFTIVLFFNILNLFTLFTLNRGYISPVGEANGSSYEALGQNTVHEYSTMQNSDLFSHGSNYETLGQETVHVYTAMQNRD